MSTNSIDRIARQLAHLRERVDRASRTPQLANSSVENGALRVKNATGQLTMVIGQQHDGTAGAAVVAGPTPPTPSAPTLTPLPGGVLVRWDGTFVDPQTGWASPVVAPMDFARVEIHVSATAAFTPSSTTMRGEIATPAGGALTAITTSTADSVTWYVKLRALSQAGKSSAASAEVTATFSGVATSAEVNALKARVTALGG